MRSYTWTDVQQAEALLARLQDLGAMVLVLTEDVLHEADVLQRCRPGDMKRLGAARRAYVRSVFALIDGGLSAASAYILEGRPVFGWVLSDGEVRALHDGVSNPSIPRPAGPRVSAVERTKIILRLGTKVAQGARADFSGAGFQAFSRATALRNSLMHPKTAGELQVGTEELVDVDLGREWFRGTLKLFFDAVAKELTERTSDMRRTLKRS